MFWFLRGLARGVQTTRYPAKVDPWTSTLPSAPAFHSRLLTPALADQVEAGCPTGAISRDGDTLLVDLGGCTGCGRCIDVAGSAVEPSGEFLLAATGRDALVKRVPIRGNARG
jgi:ferredoxin